LGVRRTQYKELIVMPESVTPTNVPLRRSRFVSGLGWFATVSGSLSVATRLVELFTVRNGHLVVVAYLAAAILLTSLGAGLIHRSSWALPLGALFVALGVVRQTVGLAVVLVSDVTLPAGADAGQARAILGAAYTLSLIWMAFLVWVFSRSRVRREFRPTSIEVSA
jgi:hypothetical protein